MFDLQTLFHYFINNDWVFESQLSDKMMQIMSEEEKREFNFDAKCIDWRKAGSDYCFGI